MIIVPNLYHSSRQVIDHSLKFIQTTGEGTHLDIVCICSANLTSLLQYDTRQDASGDIPVRAIGQTTVEYSFTFSRILATCCRLLQGTRPYTPGG